MASRPVGRPAWSRGTDYRREVSRTARSVTPAASRPRRSTAASASSGSPTTPGAAGVVRTSPPAGLDVGSAPRAVAAANSQARGQGQRRPEAGSHASPPGDDRPGHAGAEEGEPADERDGGGHGTGPPPPGDDAHRLVLLQGADDERPAGARREDRAAVAPDDRRAKHRGVLHRRQLLDPEANDRARRAAARGARPAAPRPRPPSRPTSRTSVTRPTSRAASSTSISSSPSRTRNGTDVALLVEDAPAASRVAPRGAAGGSTRGRSFSSGNSASASSRPSTRT